MEEIEDGGKVSETLGHRKAAHRERIRLEENLHVAHSPPDALFHRAFERFRHQARRQNLVQVA